MADTLPEELPEQFVVRLRQEGHARGGAIHSDFIGEYPYKEAMRAAEAKAAEFGGRARITERGLSITVYVPLPADERERVQVLREAYRKNIFRLTESRDELRAAVLDLIKHGTTEVEAARLAGVDRMTVRKWQGK